MKAVKLPKCCFTELDTTISNKSLKVGTDIASYYKWWLISWFALSRLYEKGIVSRKVANGLNNRMNYECEKPVDPVKIFNSLII